MARAEYGTMYRTLLSKGPMQIHRCYAQGVCATRILSKRIPLASVPSSHLSRQSSRAGWIEVMQPYLQNIRDPRGGDEIAPSTRNSPWRLDWKGPETDRGAVMARKGADRQSRGSEEPQFSSVRIYPERHRRTRRWPVPLKQRVRSSRRLEPGNRFEFHSVGNGEPLKNIKRVMGWFLCFIEMTLATVQ